MLISKYAPKSPKSWPVEKLKLKSCFCILIFYFSSVCKFTSLFWVSIYVRNWAFFLLCQFLCHFLPIVSFLTLSNFMRQSWKSVRTSQPAHSCECHSVYVFLECLPHKAVHLHSLGDADLCIISVSAAVASDSCHIMDSWGGRVNSPGRELCAVEVRHVDLLPLW